MKQIVNALRRWNPGQPAYAVWVLCAAAVAVPAQTTFNTLHNFDGTDGKHPVAALVQATDGNLYGTASAGGANSVSTRSGTAFKISPSGTFKAIHTFCSQVSSALDCLDGAFPMDALLQSPNGDLYGTTTFGGDNGNCNIGLGGCGIVFKLTLSGTVTAIYNFCPDGTGQGNDCTDGENPFAGVIQAINRDFYGTTSVGGINNKCYPENSCGTIFQITASGTLKTLYNFCSQSDCADGDTPYAGLIQATNGDFYGTTAFGGVASGCGGPGCGTVFKITAGGTLTTLHSFCAKSGCPDGANPRTPLIQATNGDFYGTTSAGGAHSGGTIFEITTAGQFITLYTFCSLSGCADGGGPSGPIQGTDGNLYGTTSSGGAHGQGTVFDITPSGVLTTLYSFCAQSGCPDGADPNALVQDTNGTFYGTANSGGANNMGTVFSLSVGLEPFVETLTTSGALGAAVTILGTDLTGATSVAFNGTAAEFTVVSKSEITTTVPAGATTGTVEVVTPKGTLSSNVPFQVR